MKSYLKTTEQVYEQAALTPQPALCCVQQARPHLPGLVIPPVMEAMNYGCGSTVHLQDFAEGQRMLYIGVGGGLEALQFAYFARHPGGVVAVDPVAAMREQARRNLQTAAALNDWFEPDFVELVDGSALALPLPDGAIDLVAQNCLFNIFEPDDLLTALQEVRRVLVPGGRLVLSDPIASRPIPPHLQADERLRAMCLSGCLPLEQYLGCIVEAGFGQIDIRARRPYRVLDSARYGLDANLLLESIELAAYNVPVPADGPCIFTGRTAIYTGQEEHFDDRAGHILPVGLPAAVCDKTADKLARLHHSDLVITAPTYHYQGGGCC
ncbi:arsenosugar biosynthesis arsenite methyltransferase ArsM [Gloeobacter violaceus]|uniref:Glr3355 protein n=1 Tax=Gloeobacter violaceus (strain ATCC 29082 / PCC 7421) TaxID=251221 RepID=Q7NG19_GLOVI|nr:arsenosugar biosynthesis arsenite methyltransferase ArsM [Gloeobacter violaceus]BAC91296.1 glr3355 [Gloeobacter violaceus PCC 7421]